MNKKNNVGLRFYKITLAVFFLIFALEATSKASNLDKEQETKDNSFKPTLKVGGRIMTFFDVPINETSRDTNSSLYFRRLRLKVKGEAVKNIKYHFQINRKLKIYEAWTEFTPYQFFNLTVGFLYIPFGRAFQTSSGKLLLSDRAKAGSKHDLERDMGFEIKGKVFKKQFHYWLGIFKGSGTSAVSASDWAGDDSYLVSGRLRYDFFGEWKNGKVWFKEDLKLSIGGGVLYQKKTEPTDIGSNNLKAPASQLKNVMGFTVDIGFNWKMFYFETALTYITADYYNSSGKPEDFIGVNADIGITLVPKTLLMAFRVDYWDDKPLSTASGTKSDVIALTGGFTWYIGSHGHVIKVQPEVQVEVLREGLTTGDKKSLLVRIPLTYNF